jgi:tRNA(fMet)-specific endonuclease VapC
MACLDTGVVLDIAGRGGRARATAAEACLMRLLFQGQDLCSTYFTLAELWVGVERSSRPGVEQARIEHVFSRLVILDFDDRSARLYGGITAHLQRIGRPVGDMDVLIASVAMANGQVLVTRNPKHFGGIPGLTLASY